MKKTINLNALLFTALVFISSCKKEEVKNPPVICFNASTTAATTGQDITFTNCTTGGVSYTWNFGDGQTSNEFSPHHTYTFAGTYTVTLSATNSDGTVTKTATVTISTASSPFVGTYSASQSCSFGVTTYTLSITANGANSIVIYNFDNGLTIDGYVTGTNLIIPGQAGNGSSTLSGTGTLSSDFQTLTIAYTESIGGTVYNNCTITCSKL